MKWTTFTTGLCVTLALASSTAQSSSHPAINDKIWQEAAKNSQVMRTLHYLADVYGPRVTGSPNHKAAAEWAVKTMTSWGMQNGKLEPWEFGYPGWVNEHLSVHAVSPFKDALVVEALAWTPGTKGTVKAKAFNLIVPEGPLATAEAPPAGRGGRGPQRLGPTEAELNTYLESVKSSVAGAAVLVGRHAFVPVSLEPPPGRRTDLRAQCQYEPAMANDPQCANQGRGRGGRGGGGGRGAQGLAGRLSAVQVSERVTAFLVANKAAFRVNDAARPHGQITAFDQRGRDVTKAVPTVVMRNEDYGRISRVLADHTSFNNAGLPGIGFGQDSIEYSSHTHHTNLDTYERVIEADVRDAAVVVAATLYQLAMRDQPLPRFAPDKMPPPPAPRGGGQRN